MVNSKLFAGYTEYLMLHVYGVSHSPMSLYPVSTVSPELRF